MCRHQLPLSFLDIFLNNDSHKYIMLLNYIAYDQMSICKIRYSTIFRIKRRKIHNQLSKILKPQKSCVRSKATERAQISIFISSEIASTLPPQNPEWRGPTWTALFSSAALSHLIFHISGQMSSYYAFSGHPIQNQLLNFSSFS